MRDWKNIIKYSDSDKIILGPFWSSGDNLEAVTRDLYELTKNIEYDCIATAESKGIVFAAPVAAMAGKPFLLFRKLGKISSNNGATVGIEFSNWRNSPDGIEIESYLLKEGMKVLFIDDKIERGCTLKAANTLISERGGKIVACICIGNTYGTDKINSIPIYSLL